MKAQQVTEDRRELKAFNVAQMVTLKMFALFMRTAIPEPLGLEDANPPSLRCRLRKPLGTNGRGGKSRGLRRRRRSLRLMRTSASGATLASSSRRPWKLN